MSIIYLSKRMLNWPVWILLRVFRKKTKRNYLDCVNGFPKAKATRVVKQFGYDYWDGARKYGYGGYQYDGRRRIVAESLVRHYELVSWNRILDIGCGKASYFMNSPKLC